MLASICPAISQMIERHLSYFTKVTIEQDI